MSQQTLELESAVGHWNALRNLGGGNVHAIEIVKQIRLLSEQMLELSRRLDAVEGRLVLRPSHIVVSGAGRANSPGSMGES